MRIRVFTIAMALSFYCIGFAQESVQEHMSYDIHKIYPAISLTKDKLAEVKSFEDINRYYKSSWVRRFVSVQLEARHDGKIKTISSSSDQLEQRHIDFIKKADTNTSIHVNMVYIPENTLAQEEEKEINFTFLIDPDHDAHFVGGEEKLQEYLQSAGLDKILAENFEGYQMAIVTFAISKDGKVENVQVFESTQDDSTDNHLVQTICEMPDWKPAHYDNQIKARQEFALTIGNTESCIANLVNTRAGAVR